MNYSDSLSSLSARLGLPLVLLCAAAVSLAEEHESQTIALDEIWAYDMLGTRDVYHLESKLRPALPWTKEKSDEYRRRSDIWKISKVLGRLPKEGEKAGLAFVVVGTGKEALENAQAVFSSTKNARTFIPAETDVSVVFYSHLCGRYVRLVAVEQSPDLITVKYQFVSHGTLEMTTHFALIPIGELVAGNYRVAIQQVEAVDERGQLETPVRDPQRLVSGSFGFVVRGD